MVRTSRRQRNMKGRLQVKSVTRTGWSRQNVRGSQKLVSGQPRHLLTVARYPCHVRDRTRTNKFYEHSPYRSPPHHLWQPNLSLQKPSSLSPLLSHYRTASRYPSPTYITAIRPDILLPMSDMTTFSSLELWWQFDQHFSVCWRWSCLFPGWRFISCTSTGLQRLLFPCLETEKQFTKGGGLAAHDQEKIGAPAYSISHVSSSVGGKMDWYCRKCVFHYTHLIIFAYSFSRFSFGLLVMTFLITLTIFLFYSQESTLLTSPCTAHSTTLVLEERKWKYYLMVTMKNLIFFPRKKYKKKNHRSQSQIFTV